MGRGFHLGQILGISINIDLSWIIIFILITFNLSVGFFPSIHPEWGIGLSVGIGFLASLLFFSSVLIHELLHSLVAKSRGIAVRSITLFLFGGVSDIEREPPSAVDEFLIAVVGPLTSLVLGGIFLFLSQTISSPLTILTSPMVLSQLSPLATLLFWLGSINILLGFFNLIPGFPLDGGRVLRSIIWFITANLRLATQIASFVGRGVAWLFILSGVSMIFGLEIPILGRGIINGIWLVLIGWFLNNAASLSFEETVIEDTLKNVKVSSLMQTGIPTVPPDSSVSELANKVSQTKEQIFPVVKDGHLLGLIGLADIKPLEHKLWGKTKVSEVMKPINQLKTATPQETAAEAMRKLIQNPGAILPVVEGGQLVGIISQKDIVIWLQLHEEL